MICVSLAEPRVAECLRALRGIEFAEIRIDKMSLDVNDLRKVFSSHPCLIATCRPGAMDEATRIFLLGEAIGAGAAYVDFEVDAPVASKREIVQKARSLGCRVIISYHNFIKTPARAELDHIIDWCFESGADIAKVACRVRAGKESARLLGLLDQERPLIVVGLGNPGKITRLAGPLLGSPFTYASLEVGKETADGQIDKDTLEEFYGSLKYV
jgi:3-dehydroquinate dehydratase-1